MGEHGYNKKATPQGVTLEIEETKIKSPFLGKLQIFLEAVG